MVVCPYCGKENNQPDAAYCLYCGSSLRGQPGQPVSMNQSPTVGQGYGMSGGLSSPEMADRYERTFARVELLGKIVIALAIVTLILLFV
jgi:uncharacterized membrane protein YvbJ